jgi:hypothetical protein
MSVIISKKVLNPVDGWGRQKYNGFDKEKVATLYLQGFTQEVKK